MFVPAAGKSSGVCTHEHSTLMKLNINCIYTINLRILSLCVSIDP